MEIAARRRLAVGALATSTAVIAGLLVGPALAAPEGVRINPSGVTNTNEAADLTFTTTEADLTYGGTATLVRSGGQPVTVPVDSTSPLPMAPLGDPNEGTATLDATDGGAGIGADGPLDAGSYQVSIDGEEDPSGGIFGGGGGNDTCVSCFTVLPAGAVSATSVAPNSLRPGASGNVSILGNNFERGSKIEVLFTNGDVDNGVQVNNPPTSNGQAAGTPTTQEITNRGELLRRVQVAAGTAPGVRNVLVTNLDDTKSLCSGCFFVSGAGLTSISTTAGNNSPAGSPRSAENPGSPLRTITFNGPDVVNGTPRLEFVGNPGANARRDLMIVGQNVRNATGTSITADFDLRNAAPGNNAYQPFVEGARGVVNACDTCRFTLIQDGTPTLTSLDRSNQVGVQKQLRQGETATFTVSGTNFSRGATLAFDPPAGLTVTGAQFISPTSFNATVAAAADAAPGDRAVEVVLTDAKRSEPLAAGITVVPGAGASPGPSASASASPRPSNDDFAFTRLSGNDRYATAAAIARASFTTAATVILANGQSDDPRTSRNEDHFPDALAASYLAGNRGAPTLLATETTLPTPTRDALAGLRAENVVIVGGPAAISSGVEQQLRDLGYTVSRLSGAGRYDTASAVAEEPGVEYVGEDPDGLRTAVLASGEDFADALVAGPLGYAARFPVLITAEGRLSDQTAATLEELEIEQVLIAGGPNAVSANTEAQVRAINGITTRRFAGTNRFQTATLIAEYAYDSLGFDPAHVDLAQGSPGFADALAGGPHAGVRRSPILLTLRDSLPQDTAALLSERGAGFTAGDIFGGPSAVSTAVENAAESAVRNGAEPDPSASPSGSPSASGSASPSVAPSGSAAPSGSPAPSGAPGTPGPTGSPAVSGSPAPTASSSPTGGGFPPF